MPTPHQLVLCACPDQATAHNIAEQLVDRQLAACVNILPGITSVYQWQGKRENSQEHLLLIKTTHAAYEALEQALSNLHPYELPEIIAVPIARGSDAYLDWISQSVAPKGST
jgi:periplasmic divalent cation tolerance protein